ncbi:MAG: class I SAM-dependent methyltransferase [Propionibacteriaceae bacterium]
MSAAEDKVEQHYARGNLEQQVLAAARHQGLDPDHLEAADLHPADQLHVGGPLAVQNLARGAQITAGTRVLDLGCGIGGPARHLAASLGADVTGVDVTTEFVEVAISLTRRCRLDQRVRFVRSSVLSLPFDDDTFDVATLLAVGMNLPDKQAVFTEAARVLRPGGVLAISDVMRLDSDEREVYPQPWADTAADSFVESTASYARHLTRAGLEVEVERCRQAFALEHLDQLLPPAGAPVSGGPPPGLGLHLVMGPGGVERMQNLVAALRAGVLAPAELYARVC